MSRKTAIRAKDFRAWFRSNLKEYARDIAEHGADSGFPFITYNSEAAHVFDKFAAEIWAMAVEDAESMGCRNVAEMIAGFGRADMAEDWQTSRAS